MLGRSVMLDLTEFSVPQLTLDYNRPIWRITAKDREEGSTPEGLPKVTPFVTTLLWNIRGAVGEGATDRLLWRAVEFMTIRTKVDGLRDALSRAGDEDFANDPQKKAALRAVLNRAF